MPYRLPASTAAAVRRARRGLRGTSRLLFDLLCLAGHLGRAFPYRLANTALVAGPRDPRRPLRRFLARQIGQRATPSPARWRRASAVLVEHIGASILTAHDDPALHPVRLLLGNASIALAPDCAVPTEPALRAAWDTLVAAYGRRYGDAVHVLTPLPWLDRRTLATMRREAARGVREGRGASGMRPGLHGRVLAIDPRLMRRVSRVLGRRVVPAYEARYVFYTRPGDYFFPHPDDPEHALNLLVCLDRRPPDGHRRPSAFLAYRANGVVERHEVPVGGVVVAEARGVIHAREALGPGERVTLLSIAARYAPARRASRR
ncbi:MAG: hypothetical protein U0P30_01520 [Vicinamibacterales bacterium]